MERRTYDQLFGSFSNEQFQRNILMNQFITFNPMCSSIRGVHSMYRNDYNIVSFIRINSCSRRNVFFFFYVVLM
uniref:NADH dehydrogenase subunit 2 n=1 Tax=Abies chensiensis TaxID=425836 RepID=A0A4D6EW03_9CONI|nr:NADH dehydrogenase subunit 2 [Abies chensiensis]